MTKSEQKTDGPVLRVKSEVARQIRQHARSSSKTEVCGVLIGREAEDQVIVEAAIAGVNAAQGGTHVTFTQDTWEHIYAIKDREYPAERIVGWYHSHPGFGVFLSDHDTFIHENFFSSPQQVAWVYDPQSDEEGCFGWVAGRLERLSKVTIVDGKGGERAGESGEAEPIVIGADEAADTQLQAPSGFLAEPPAWLRWTTTILSYFCVAVLGFALCWFEFPKPVPVPVDVLTGNVVDIKTGELIDPRTGQVVGHLGMPGSSPLYNIATPPDAVSGKAGSPAVSGAPTTPDSSNPASEKKGDHAQR